MITGHFLDPFDPAADGAVRVAQGYREHMERELGPSWVVAPSHPDAPALEPRVLRYASVPFLEPSRLGVAFGPRVRERVARIAWDVVHAHSPFSAGQLAAEAARERRAPLVFSLHTSYAEWARMKYRASPRWASVLGLDALLQPASGDRLRAVDLLHATSNGEAYVTRAVQRRVWRYAANTECVIVSTASAREELRSFAEVAEAGRQPRIEVIPPGIRAFETSAHELGVRARHALPQVPLLLYVGQLTDESGLAFLLEAIAEPQARKFPFRLLIAGQGSRQAHYEKLAQRLGIAERCVFTGAIADPAELAAYFRAASLLVFPSRLETESLVVMEAASVGLCTLGLRGVAGVSELITDGVSGFLAEPTALDYAARITTVLRDTALLRSVGERARRIVRSADAAAADVVELYRDLRADRAASPSSGVFVSSHQRPEALNVSA